MDEKEKRIMLMAAAIKHFVLLSGQTQAEIARLSGYSDGEFSKIVNARRGLVREELPRIAQAVGVHHSQIRNKARSLSRKKWFMTKLRDAMERRNAARASLEKVGR